MANTATPQQAKVTIDTVSISNQANLKLGDLRALLVRAEGLPDDAIVSVANTSGNLFENHRYVRDIAITARRTEVVTDSDHDSLEGVEGR